jgi:hypothetical protein
MANLQMILDSIKEQLNFNNDAVETLVEAAFTAGGAAMVALIEVDRVNEKAETPQDLTDYISGIAGLTQSVGSFLDSLTEEQEAAYRSNLKKVITNPVPSIELALEAFADANLDLTAAVLNVNDAIDELEAADEV